VQELSASESILQKFMATGTLDAFRWPFFYARVSLVLNGVGPHVIDAGRKGFSKGVEKMRTLNLTSTEVKSCEVHNIPLRLGFAKIAYGLLSRESAYFEDMPHLFPHSMSWVGGGCILSSVKVARVNFCPQCREAEVLWHQVKKLLSNLEE
jgi:hypothetical protein